MERFIEFVGQLVGDYAPKQIAVASSVAAGGGVAALFFGGWSGLLTILLIMVGGDFITGIMASGVEGKLRSSIGLVGIARKVFIFLIISIAHQVDTVLGDQHLLRDTTVFFYMANEMLSIIENGGRIGVPIPAVIRKAVEVLKGKGGEGHRN